MEGMAQCDVYQTVWAEHGLTNPIMSSLGPQEKAEFFHNLESIKVKESASRVTSTIENSLARNRS